jgi:hypothetical protein
MVHNALMLEENNEDISSVLLTHMALFLELQQVGDFHFDYCLISEL